METVWLSSWTLQLRYYSAQKGGVYTLTQTVTLAAQEEQNITLTF